MELLDEPAEQPEQSQQSESSIPTEEEGSDIDDLYDEVPRKPLIIRHLLCSDEPVLMLWHFDIP